MADGALKVLMLAPTPYFADRGCHVRIYEEAISLTRMGHHVCIVTYHLGRDMPGIRTVRIPVIPWYNKLEAGPSWHKPYLDLLLFLKACSAIRAFRPDLIHAHLHEGTLIGYLLKFLFRLPLLFDYQGSLSGESLDHGFLRKGSLLHKLFSTVETFINCSADAIVTSSGDGRRKLVSDFGIPAGKITTLIDGVDADVFQPLSKLEARRQLGISLNSKVVVYLGLFNAYQGLDLLMESIPLVRVAVPDVHFLLMGFPDQEYRRKACALKIDDVTTFTGRVDYQAAPLLLSAGDLAVSPKLALTEANGKLFNYMACGLPTVVFESEINHEILGECGIYAEYGNVESLAGCIVDVLNNSELLREKGILSRQRAVDVHSWSVRAGRLVEVYTNLIKTDKQKK